MFLTKRFYLLIVLTAILMALGIVWSPMLIVGQVALVALTMAVVLDALNLYMRVKLSAQRECPERFSNGDDNQVTLHIKNSSSQQIGVTVIDELPPDFQKRDFKIKELIAPKKTIKTTYNLRPTHRGEYHFGNIIVYATSRIGLVQRRFTCGEPTMAKVYPSYVMLRKFELLAMSNNLTEIGIKRIRRAGNNTDFEQIKDYVQGDEYRRINWKASARRTHLMVNVYQDERSQQIFNLIDKGRLMQQAFKGMTLLDYAINASLVLSYVAIHRQDKAGLVTFADKFDSFVKAESNTLQMKRIMDSLYNQQTTFGESDYSMLCPNINKLVGKRSLLILYTNFTDFGALRRQLPYLRMLNRRHRLLVVFFDDPELHEFATSPQKSEVEYFEHVIAEKMIYDRRLIVSTLRQNGIYSLLTTPDHLSVNVINKYIEMKTRQLLT